MDRREITSLSQCSRWILDGHAFNRMSDAVRYLMWRVRVLPRRGYRARRARLSSY